MTNPDAIKPVAHLVWLQGRRAGDDVEDYYEVARPGDKCVDGSDPFPVYSSEQMVALEAECARLRELVSSSEAQRYRKTSELLERALVAEALLAEAAEALQPFAQAALVVRSAERIRRRDFPDGAAFQSGIAWEKDGGVQTITYGHIRALRALLLKLQDHPHE